ncbi:MAG: divalent-cation tolerance protein CutA [Bacteroidia bacterium]|nr:divalent-cation tolerance protein CutA [Bacteroidia bacterium]
MSEYILVLTTTSSLKDAETIATALLEDRLAACVQISSPVKSYYRWKNNMENAEEYQMFIKTKNEAYKKLEAKIKQVHPYETPQIIGIPIVEGYQEYLKWLDSEVL